MIVQTVVWTLLPDPAEPPASDGTAMLTLLASPRLGTDDPPGTPPTATQLSDYPELAAWPSLAPSTSVEIVGPDRPRSDRRPPRRSGGRPGLWGAIFPPNQPVTPFTFGSLAGVPVTTYSAATVSGSLAHQYTGMLPAAPNPIPAAAENPWAPIDQLIATLGVGGTAPEETRPR